VRRAHNLKVNHTNESVHEAIWTDTETAPVKQPDGSDYHYLMFGYGAYARTVRPNEWTRPLWARYQTVNEYWDWVEDRLHGKSRLYMFAHNWAFDAPVLDTFNVLPERGWKLTGSIIQSPPVILKWRRGPHTIQMVDTLNIWRVPLKKLGESIGLPKLTMPDYGAPEADWNAYGKRDVEIIMQACQQWWSFLIDNDLGGFASTLAAQAFRTFRHRFMTNTILIDDNVDALNLAREALHGGRTECFYIGVCPVTVTKLDINSQYPAIMRREVMPAKLIGHYKRVTMHELIKWSTRYCLVAQVQVHTNQPAYAVVHDKRLIFPTGEFVTVLCTPEIEYALLHGHIIKVFDVSVYEPKLLFKEYVNWMHQYRQRCRESGDEVAAINAKLLMNSLYGKFAQKGLIYKKIDDTDDTEIKVWVELDVETNTVYHLRQYGGIIEQLEQETESRDSHPAIAAHITAHARMQLWGLIQMAGRGNVFYCDTDSIWVNETGAKRLKYFLDATALGKLKVEGVHDDVIIHGPKDYLIDGHARIKGIRKNAKQIGPNTFEQDKFTTLVGLLRIGQLSAPVVTRLTKRLRREYTKGIVDALGNVSPLSLPR
jgi:hypothetical protein